jgi:Putative adhesin
MTRSLPVTEPLPLTAGRRVALAAGVPAALLLIGSAAVSVPGWHLIHVLLGERAYQVRLAVPVRDRAVTLQLSPADVSIAPGRAAAGSAAQVTARGSYWGRRPSFTVHATPAGTSVQSSCSGRPGLCSLRYAVAVPAGTATAATEDSGDVTVRRLAGPVTVQAGGGDVLASALAGPVRISDRAGDVILQALSGPEVTVSDLAGDVTGSGLAVPGLTVTDRAGDVTLAFSRVPARVWITCLSGDVTLLLPPGGTAYQVTARARLGAVRVGVPVSASAPDVISVTDAAGDISIGH